MLTLIKTGDQAGQFIAGDGKGHFSYLGIVAKQTKAGRWQYRDADTKHLIASGMEPAAFAKRFWYRDDFTCCAWGCQH